MRLGVHLVLFLCGWCYSSGGICFSTCQADEGPASLAGRAAQVLQTRCFRCHGGNSTSAGLNVISSESMLAKRGTEEAAHAFVVPDDAAGSLLWQAVESGYMPLDDSPEARQMTDEERQMLKEWIDAGAELPLREVAQPVDLTTTYRSIVSYLDSRPSEDRQYYRFFSLAHLYNNAEVSEQDLRYTRAALAKVLNSLIFKRATTIELSVVPQTQEAIYAIDLRDMEWDKNGNWQHILGVYPYAVQFEFSEDRALRDAYVEAQRKAGTDQPIIRADWFIVHGSQHPLYTILMELPASLDGLEERLGVDVIENIRAAKVMRAGFSRSGVSRQNRLIERHEGNDGYVWISYDFRPNKPRVDLARFPLGPLFAGHPFAKSAFSHDGGELIFRLPNGLQGYMLVTGDGSRLDGPAPADIVFDPSGVAGGSAILNGISCMNCHARGIILGNPDDVRNSHTVGGPAQDFLERIYPERDQMNRAIETDRQSYAAAEAKITSRFLEKADVGEPVGKVALRYYASVDVRTAAMELGMFDLQALQAAIALNRNLAALGLGRLAPKNASTIQRAVWESGDGLTYWQEVMAAVHPGAMPIAPKNAIAPRK